MRLGAVILAAGSGRRLGGAAKALLSTGQDTFLGAIVHTARRVGAVDVVVVTGPPYGPEVAREAVRLGARVVENAAPWRGMASSVALGFARLTDGVADAAWLWPVDHPHVRADTLARLARDATTHGASLVKPRRGTRSGHPPLVARSLWPALAACADVEGGARAVLGRVPDVRVVGVDDPGVVEDVDTPRERLRGASEARRVARHG